MSALSIKNAGDVYQFVDDLKTEAKRSDMNQLADQLENALLLGSSALEILGAVRQAVVDNHNNIERLLGPDGKDRAEGVIAFVDRAFGR